MGELVNFAMEEPAIFFEILLQVSLLAVGSFVLLKVYLSYWLNSMEIDDTFFSKLEPMDDDELESEEAEEVFDRCTEEQWNNFKTLVEEAPVPLILVFSSFLFL